MNRRSTIARAVMALPDSSLPRKIAAEVLKDPSYWYIEMLDGRNDYIVLLETMELDDDPGRRAYGAATAVVKALKAKGFKTEVGPGGDDYEAAIQILPIS